MPSFYSSNTPTGGQKVPKQAPLRFVVDDDPGMSLDESMMQALMLFLNGSWSGKHTGTGSISEPAEGVSPNLTDPAGSEIEPAGCSTPPLPFDMVRKSNWPCCLIFGSKPRWIETPGKWG
jgi:hypothetical protein